MKRYRVAWKSSTGYEGRGDWRPAKEKEMLEVYVNRCGQKWPTVKHWVEEEEVADGDQL